MFKKLGKSLAKLVTSKKEEVSKDHGDKWFNPEGITENKREWIDAQPGDEALCSWPEHLFEHFFVVGLPPNTEVSLIAEDLCEKERYMRDELGLPPDADNRQYDQPPYPAYEASIIYQYPPTVPAPISDKELADLCFPHKVAPTKLRRSPSLSSLSDVIYAKHNTREDQTCVFMLKAGTNNAMFGVCCYVEEMLHRPPVLGAAPDTNKRPPATARRGKTREDQAEEEGREGAEGGSEQGGTKQAGGGPAAQEDTTPTREASELVAAAGVRNPVRSRSSLPSDRYSPAKQARALRAQQSGPTTTTQSARASPRTPTVVTSNGRTSGSLRETPEHSRGTLKGLQHGNSLERLSGGMEPHSDFKPSPFSGHSYYSRAQSSHIGDRLSTDETYNGRLWSEATTAGVPTPTTLPANSYCKGCAAIIKDMQLTSTDRGSMGNRASDKPRQSANRGTAQAQQHNNSPATARKHTSAIASSMSCTSVDSAANAVCTSPTLPSDPDPMVASTSDRAPHCTTEVFECELCGLDFSLEERLSLPTPGCTLSSEWLQVHDSPVYAENPEDEDDAQDTDMLHNGAWTHNSGVNSKMSSHEDQVKAKLPRNRSTPTGRPQAFQEQASCKMSSHKDQVPESRDDKAGRRSEESLRARSSRRTWTTMQSSLYEQHPYLFEERPSLIEQMRQSARLEVDRSPSPSNRHSAPPVGHSKSLPVAHQKAMYSRATSNSLQASPRHPVGKLKQKVSARLQAAAWLRRTPKDGKTMSDGGGGGYREGSPQRTEIIPLGSRKSHSGITSPRGVSGFGFGSVISLAYKALANSERIQNSVDVVQASINGAGDAAGSAYSPTNQQSPSAYSPTSTHSSAFSPTYQQSLSPPPHHQPTDKSSPKVSPVARLEPAASSSENSVGRTRSPAQVSTSRPVQASSSENGVGRTRSPAHTGSRLRGSGHHRRSSTPQRSGFHPVSGPSTTEVGDTVPKRAKPASQAVAEASEMQAGGSDPAAALSVSTTEVGDMVPNAAEPASQAVAEASEMQAGGSDPAAAQSASQSPQRSPDLNAAQVHPGLGPSGAHVTQSQSQGQTPLFNSSDDVAAASSSQNSSPQRKSPLYNSSDEVAAASSSHNSSPQKPPLYNSSGEVAAVSPSQNSSPRRSTSGREFYRASFPAIYGDSAPSAAVLSPSGISSASISHNGHSSAQSKSNSLRESRHRDSGESSGVGPINNHTSAGLNVPQFSPMLALDTIYSAPVVPPGDYLMLNVGGISTIRYMRPHIDQKFEASGPASQIAAYSEAESAHGMQSWTTAALARNLSLDNIIKMLTAVLLERQMVIFCPNLAVCSAVVLSVMPLLRPYAWQSLLMPVTPSSMLGFLDAPVPFIIGLQYKTPDVTARCTDLIRINAYKNQVANASLPTLPNYKALYAALEPHYAVLHGGPDMKDEAAGRPLHLLSEEEEVASGSLLLEMRAYLTTMCGDFRPHIITNVGMSRRTGTLMADSLLDSAPLKDRPFLREFTKTQMFSVYSDQVISTFCEKRS
eukprot:gene9780-7663_t